MNTVSIFEDKTKLTELDSFIVEKQALEFPDSYLIAVLHKAQDIYGYLNADVMRLVAARMRLPISRIWGVATFYHYFNLKPCGKYVISVCLGTACYVKGAQKIFEAIKQELGIEVGETTPDMVFTLLETRCLGACGLAPTMMVNKRIYGELTPKKAVDLLRRMRAEYEKTAVTKKESA
jgi:NADH:ubiquinone oxidoreductase subunit E